jgi:hypothetical protein
VGSYTLLIPRDELNGPPTNSPGGIGSGAITNDLKGFAKASIFVGDVGHQQKAVFKTSLSKDGEYPLYIPLYRSTTIVASKTVYLGSMMGWMTFGDSNTAPVCENLTWIKPTMPVGDPNFTLLKPINLQYYAAGFTNQVDMLASPYTAVGKNEHAIELLNNLQVVLSDGNLAVPVTNVATVIATNKVLLPKTNTAGETNKMVISFNKKFGTFIGNMVNPDLTKTFFVGSLLQNTTNASGHFLGTTNSGSVIITGN